MHCIVTVASLLLWAVVVEARPLHAGLNYHRYLQEKDAIAERLQRWLTTPAAKQAGQNNWGFNVSALEERDGEPNEDQLQRFALTEQTIETLQKQNPLANFSTKSPFTLMTPAEFKSYVGQSFTRASGLPSVPMARHQIESERDGETSKDWLQETGCIGRVKDQGQCASCWAFGAIAAIEAAYCLKNNRQLIHFSEQHLTSCSQQDFGCNGGYPQNGIELVRTQGACREEAWPFSSGQTGRNGQCRVCPRNSVVNTQIQRVVMVDSTEQALEDAVRRQPVAVGVGAGNAAWKQYAGGVMSQCPSEVLDHVVLVYGFTQQHWLVKNSWGAQWGESGFLKMARNVDVGPRRDGAGGNGLGPWGRPVRGIWGGGGGLWGGGGGAGMNGMDLNISGGGWGLCGMLKIMVYPQI